MKKFCNVHRFFYETMCPFCTKDKYRNVLPVVESAKKERDITEDDLSKLVQHFKNK